MSYPAALTQDSGKEPIDERGVAIQDRLLPGVSRTFALTIPQLPQSLRIAVTNAYLLCRIADTVEDDESIDHDEKIRLQSILLEVISGTTGPDKFAGRCMKALNRLTPASERNLIAHTPQIVTLTHSLNRRQRDAIERCLNIMCRGMSEFDRNRSLRGLSDMAELDRYCYVVAGCVGEMLTELFCDYSPAIASQKPHMMPLAKSFGQGLQMTNILKDVWEDREHDACWLPRDVFAARGINVRDLPINRDNAPFADCINQLIGIARYHLRSALEYTKLLPTYESGIRNFCLWAIGLAVLTLRNIHNRPNFANGHEVKVSRRALRSVIATSNMLSRHNFALSLAFSLSARGLPRLESYRGHSLPTAAGS